MDAPIFSILGHIPSSEHVTNSERSLGEIKNLRYPYTGRLSSGGIVSLGRDDTDLNILTDSFSSSESRSILQAPWAVCQDSRSW